MNADLHVSLAADLLQRGHAIQTSVFFRTAHPLIGASDALAIVPGNGLAPARLVGRLVAVNVGKSLLVQRVVRSDATRRQVYIKSDLSRSEPAAVALAQVVGHVSEIRKATGVLRLDGPGARAIGRLVAVFSTRLVDKAGLPVALGTARRRFFRSLIKLLFAVLSVSCKRSLPRPPAP